MFIGEIEVNTKHLGGEGDSCISTVNTLLVLSEQCSRDVSP